MTRLSIRVKANAELVRSGLENLQKEVPAVGRRQIYEVMVRTKNRMQKPAPRPKYPIEWDSEKQKAAFFASGGFGSGIPHQRSGEYGEGITIEQTEKGYVIENPYEGAQYIGGDAYGQRQSGINAGRWPLFRTIFDEEVEKLPSAVQDELAIVSKRIGF